MPPKKKYVLSTTVRWSAFEVELFRYLASITGHSMADETRSAVRFYASHLPGFDPDGFRSFVKRDSASTVPKGPDRDALLMETEAFIEQAQAHAPEALTLDPDLRQQSAISSSAADFE